MKTHNCCPACAGLRYDRLKGYEKHHLYRCRYCRMVFSMQYPEDRELEAHYDQYSRDDYLSPITIKRYHELLKRFKPYRQTGNILDIGCGIGYFLDEAKKEGWKTYGTEISDRAIEICREKAIEIPGKGLDDLKGMEGQFDIVTAFEVIEHLSHPENEIIKIKDLVRPGGVIYLTTPNFNSLNRRILGSKWDVLSFPEHLSYFTKISIHKLLVQHNFDRISLVTDGVSPGRIRSSLTGKPTDHSSSDTTDEMIRRNIESNVMLKRGRKFLNNFLNRLSLGESLKALYRKL